MFPVEQTPARRRWRMFHNAVRRMERASMVIPNVLGAIGYYAWSRCHYGESITLREAWHAERFNEEMNS